MTTFEIIDTLPEKLFVKNQPFGELHMKRISGGNIKRKFKVWYESPGRESKVITPVFKGEGLRDAVVGLYKYLIDKGYIDKEQDINNNNNN